jgi:UDP-N-acetylglucosamine 2-epimerase (non-hydrolysing)
MRPIKKKILFIFGTRPEAIKLAPLVLEFQKFPDLFDIRVCVTAQHREMLDQVLNFFEISADFDLDIMKPGQSLFDVTIAGMNGLKDVLQSVSPDWIIVQGDTTTTFTATLAAYYLQIKVAHIEAGLRSFNKLSPFPEEINRVLTSHIADLHFAPTEKAKTNLIKEGITKKDIFNVGNTVIDALLHGALRVKDLSADHFGDVFKDIKVDDLDKKIILVTGHRRESFGEPFLNICKAIKELSLRDDVTVVYPVHLNPNVRKPVYEILDDLDNVYLIEPLEYAAFIWLMQRSYLILTDSGGVQEEAPSLGKPVLVMRDVTERTEGIETGTAKLVGTDIETIISEATTLLDDSSEYQAMANSKNPYGDGESSQKIREVLAER